MIANDPPASSQPLAYFITFSCYGHRVFGDAEGTVDRTHNVYRTPFLPPVPHRAEALRERMRQPPYELDADRRDLVLSAIRETCAHRGWKLLAVHVRENHVHLAVEAARKPEKVLSDLKAYASRALTRAGYESSERLRWARHGSTVYLWTPEDIRSAVLYVVEEQGVPMAVWWASDIK